MKSYGNDVHEILQAKGSMKPEAPAGIQISSSSPKIAQQEAKECNKRYAGLIVYVLEGEQEQAKSCHLIDLLPRCSFNGTCRLCA